MILLKWLSELLLEVDAVTVASGGWPLSSPAHTPLNGTQLRFKLHPPAKAFFSHYGVELRACKPRDAKRKGKVERPFRDLKESFLTELDALGPPSSIDELNALSVRWLEKVHARTHRTTGEPPTERLGAERQLLGELAPFRFDTSYVESRRVHVAVPRIEFGGVYYSVPVVCLGQKVEVRQEVDSKEVEIRWAGETVARHRVPAEGITDVWDAVHWQAAQAAALGRSRRHLHLVVPEAISAPEQMRLEIDGDVSVEPVDLSRFEVLP